MYKSMKGPFSLGVAENLLLARTCKIRKAQHLNLEEQCQGLGRKSYRKQQFILGGKVWHRQ